MKLLLVLVSVPSALGRSMTLFIHCKEHKRKAVLSFTVAHGGLAPGETSRLMDRCGLFYLLGKYLK